MKSGKSDHICQQCKLRFKNAASFENHKRKFCRIGDESPPAASRNNRIEIPTRSAANDFELWCSKPASHCRTLSSSESIEVCEVRICKFGAIHMKFHFFIKYTKKFFVMSLTESS